MANLSPAANDLYLTMINHGGFYKKHCRLGARALAGTYNNPAIAQMWCDHVARYVVVQMIQYAKDFSARDVLMVALELESYYRNHVSEMTPEDQEVLQRS